MTHDDRPAGVATAHLITPRAVPRVWGGTRFADRAQSGGSAPSPAIGEVWFGDLDAGGHPLVKLLDVADRLSVQVHPTDALAAELHGPGAIGKREAWVILDAIPGAHLLLGRGASVRPDELRRALEAGDDVAPLLASVPVAAGDVLDVPPGTLHALMPGLLVWEVQQPSDRTYRVSDWGRRSDERPLHRSEALRAVDTDATSQLVARLDWDSPGVRVLLRNEAFVVTVAVGPWSEPIHLADGATATLVSRTPASDAIGRVAGLSLRPLQSARLTAGSVALDLPLGAALLVASRR